VRPRLTAALALLGACLAAPAAQADPVADFYRGRTVQLVIGYSTGGGYDTYARALARYLGKHIPGNPTIVPQNMPGAGSLKAMNFLYAVAPKDGSTFGTIGRGIPLEPLLGGEGARFDPNKMNWIGSITNEVSICMSWHTSPIRSFDDLMTRELVVGSTGSGSDTEILPTAARAILGAKFKIVAGYPGGADVLLAIERGEVAGRCGWSWSSVAATRPSWIKEDKMHILFQVGLERHHDLPDVPLILELAKTDQQRAALKLIFSQQLLARPFVAPPGVPAERVAALRQAFDETMTDPDFAAEARRIELEVNPIGGAPLQALLAEVYASPPDVVALATHAVKH
jgi:tripartite-type tricarboxylate transporter receptor subunit TctC